jgi:uncharacterized MnhB-related membrane protein
MNGSVRSSAGLVWRHQRLVWWIFAVNLLLAWLASLPARATLSAVLDHSLESAKLVTGFDLGTFVMLLERPDVQLPSLASGAVGASLIFLVYLLFIDGGVLTVYVEDRKLSRAEFFENSGLFFWRMVRLALYSVVPFGLLMAANNGIARFAGKLWDEAPPDRLGFYVYLGGKLLVVVLALFVRLCFDLAQARVVRDNERKLFAMLWRSMKLAFRSGKLYASYLGIGLIAAAAFALGIDVWLHLPHSAMGASFLVLELVTITQIVSRLWMKAASARWVALLPGEVALAPAPVEEVVLEVAEIQGPQPDGPLPE